MLPTLPTDVVAAVLGYLCLPRNGYVPALHTVEAVRAQLRYPRSSAWMWRMEEIDNVMESLFLCRLVCRAWRAAAQLPPFVVPALVRGVFQAAGEGRLPLGDAVTDAPAWNDPSVLELAPLPNGLFGIYIYQKCFRVEGGSVVIPAPADLVAQARREGLEIIHDVPPEDAEHLAQEDPGGEPGGHPHAPVHACNVAVGFGWEAAVAKGGWVAATAWLMGTLTVVPQEAAPALLYLAARNTRVPIFVCAHLLRMVSEEVAPGDSACLDAALCAAASTGNLFLLRLLLEDNRVQAACNKGKPMQNTSAALAYAEADLQNWVRAAMQRGHARTLRTLSEVYAVHSIGLPQGLGTEALWRTSSLRVLSDAARASCPAVDGVPIARACWRVACLREALLVLAIVPRWGGFWHFGDLAGLADPPADHGNGAAPAAGGRVHHIKQAKTARILEGIVPVHPSEVGLPRHMVPADTIEPDSESEERSSLLASTFRSACYDDDDGYKYNLCRPMDSQDSEVFPVTPPGGWVPLAQLVDSVEQWVNRQWPDPVAWFLDVCNQTDWAADQHPWAVGAPACNEAVYASWLMQACAAMHGAQRQVRTHPRLCAPSVLKQVVQATQALFARVVQFNVWRGLPRSLPNALSAATARSSPGPHTGLPHMDLLEVALRMHPAHGAMEVALMRVALPYEALGLTWQEWDAMSWAEHAQAVLTAASTRHLIASVTHRRAYLFWKPVLRWVRRVNLRTGCLSARPKSFMFSAGPGIPEQKGIQATFGKRVMAIRLGPLNVLQAVATSAPLVSQLAYSVPAFWALWGVHFKMGPRPDVGPLWPRVADCMPWDLALEGPRVFGPPTPSHTTPGFSAALVAEVRKLCSSTARDMHMNAAALLLCIPNLALWLSEEDLLFLRAYAPHCPLWPMLCVNYAEAVPNDAPRYYRTLSRATQARIGAVGAQTESPQGPEGPHLPLGPQ